MEGLLVEPRMPEESPLLLETQTEARELVPELLVPCGNEPAIPGKDWFAEPLVSNLPWTVWFTVPLPDWVDENVPLAPAVEKLPARWDWPKLLPLESVSMRFVLPPVVPDVAIEVVFWSVVRRGALGVLERSRGARVGEGSLNRGGGDLGSLR